ncbi:MAG TPA: cupin domain-containing protein [Chloroflexota bacterium]|nr:cupin domain-containing protein [Chloroflexota bacterium]
MSELNVVNLAEITSALSNAPKPVNVLWQEPHSVAFVARGRVGRSEFHIDPSDEVMYVIKGTLDLHYITPEGERKVATLQEGEVVYCPAGTPHSPHFAPDAFLLVLERQRHHDEDDRFVWYCDQCGAKLYETSRYVPDYHQDPVSRVYEEFYGSEAHRTCQQCGHVAPLPSTVPAAR